MVAVIRVTMNVDGMTNIDGNDQGSVTSQQWCMMVKTNGMQQGWHRGQWTWNIAKRKQEKG